MSLKQCVFVMFSVLFLMSCGLDTKEEPLENNSVGQDVQNTPTVQQLPPVNYFTKARPEKICGESGYAFLLQQYFQPRCGGSCHSEKSTVRGALPYFGDANPTVAFAQIQFVTKDRILSTITNNPFCGDPKHPEFDCNLNKSGEVYLGVLEWLSHRTSCP